jgi:2-oxoisovalerate dehydrogenase E1 component
LYTALAAAAELQDRYGCSAEIVDLRAATPLNYTPLAESVIKTGRVLLVSDAVERGSLMHTVATTLTQLCFDHLDAPLVVVGSRNWITPAAELEAMFFPQVAWLLDAIHERVVPLPGHRPSTDQTLAMLTERARRGV